MGESQRSRPTLAELRQLIGEVDGNASRAELSFSLLEPSGGPGAGLSRGTVCELSGPAGNGKTEAVLKFLSEHPELRVAWVEDRFTAYPCAFEQQGVALSRVLFVEAGEESLWAALQILRSHLFGVVVLSFKKITLDERELRRLQMAAEKSGAVVILLSAQRTLRGAWALSFQAEVCRREESTLEIRAVKWRRVKPWNARISNQWSSCRKECQDGTEAGPGPEQSIRRSKTA